MSEGILDSCFAFSWRMTGKLETKARSQKDRYTFAFFGGARP
jgi:hypothetical protein